jgi:hypothetical protein
LTLEEIGAEFGDHVEIQLRDVHVEHGKVLSETGNGESFHVDNTEQIPEKAV